MMHNIFIKNQNMMEFMGRQLHKYM